MGDVRASYCVVVPLHTFTAVAARFLIHAYLYLIPAFDTSYT